MSKRSFPPPDYEPFEHLPVEFISGADGFQQIGVHVAGRLDDVRPPIICIADYCRNMSDYRAFVRQFHHQRENNWPMVLIDLAGTGRSPNRGKSKHYSTTNDGRDVGSVCAALGIEHGIFLGQGYGGQVIMALASQNAHLICASILIDAAPVVHAPGLVRLRDNLSLITEMRGKKQFEIIAHQAFGKSYPGITEKELDQIISRTFVWSRSGRAKPLFDFELIKRLDSVQVDDVFEPQWPMFHMLAKGPMMLMRTQLTDQLGRTTFERMGNLRTDAVQLVIPGQGSPALLEGSDEVGAIADFVAHVTKRAKIQPIVWG